MGALRWLVSEAEAGERLDRALAALADVPRAQARRWIDEDRVRLTTAEAGAEARARPARRVAQGDAIEADPPEPVAARLEPEAIALEVLHEDADVIVDCAPLFEERFLLTREAVRQDKPLVECAIVHRLSHRMPEDFRDPNDPRLCCESR